MYKNYFQELGWYLDRKFNEKFESCFCFFLSFTKMVENTQPILSIELYILDRFLRGSCSWISKKNSNSKVHHSLWYTYLPLYVDVSKTKYITWIKEDNT